jgi:hypothetical protein
MGCRAVITLQIVLDGQLPVRVYPVGFSVSDFCMFQIVGTQGLADVLQRCQKVSRVGVAVDEYQAHVAYASYRLQPMSGGVKVRHDMGFPRGLQRAVDVVNPAVIGADIGLAVPDDLLADPCATMATDVVHCDDLTRFGPRDDDRILANFYQLIITGRRNFACVKRVNPALENQVFELLLMNKMRAIEIVIHGVVRPALFGLQLVTHALEGIVYGSRYGMHGVSPTIDGRLVGWSRRLPAFWRLENGRVDDLAGRQKPCPV